MSDKLRNKSIVDEMNTSFLDYAMSVIVSRALPDVRDGMKPVHRRILYAMSEIGNYADKPYKKSARIVGDVIGKYHPHGDTAVYEAMVRMAQDFSFRDMLVDGHGNFGSLDGDGAAAMRYTEARMSKIAMEMLRDIGKNTIDYQENYDATEKEPVVLPGKFPNLLVNGTSGIAVGMSTNIPPHNLGEVIDGTIAYLNNNDITIRELMEYIKGPDFPLGAEILGVQGIAKAYETGNGSIKVRGQYNIYYEKNDKATIVFHNIPYMVNKANLVEKIADNIKNKRIEGITDLRDESDRDGIRIVMELRRGMTPEVVINNLFKYTQLENNFPANMLALVKGEPKVLNLKEILANFVEHQVEVIERRTKYDLDKAQARIHILEGLHIAVHNIDEVIEIIKTSANADEARKRLEERFDLTEIQSKAILEMRLQKLTGLEIEKLEAEIAELKEIIAELEDILARPERVRAIIEEELLDIRERFATPRRSEILYNYIDNNIEYEDLIEEEEVIITLTNSGYVKRMKSDQYRLQNRGGKGLKGMSVSDEDRVEHIISLSTHSDLMFFTNTGRVYRTRAHRVPEYSRTARGLPLVNIVDLQENEKITNILSVKDYSDGALVFITKKGIGKKTKLTEYERVNKNGKKALNLREDDEVVSVFTACADDKIIVTSKLGNAVVFESSDLRDMGRTSTGVKVMSFKMDDDVIISGNIVNDGDLVLSISENGYGKNTEIEDYRVTKRGGKGVRNMKVTEKTGAVACTVVLAAEEQEKTDLLIITEQGQTIRVATNTISTIGRNTQGVRVMRLNEGEKISTIELIHEEEIEQDNEENASETTQNEEREVSDALEQ